MSREGQASYRIAGFICVAIALFFIGFGTVRYVDEIQARKGPVIEGRISYCDHITSAKRRDYCNVEYQSADGQSTLRARTTDTKEFIRPEPDSSSIGEWRERQKGDVISIQLSPFFSNKVYVARVLPEGTIEIGPFMSLVFMFLLSIIPLFSATILFFPNSLRRFGIRVEFGK